MAELEREYVISENTYEALAEHGAYETEREILIFENEYNGQPVVFEDARYVHIEEIKDVASGYAGGYKAIYNDVEFMISSSTYNVLKEAGALCNEET